jgi:hypothetical protein
MKPDTKQLFDSSQADAQLPLFARLAEPFYSVIFSVIFFLQRYAIWLNGEMGCSELRPVPDKAAGFFVGAAA